MRIATYDDLYDIQHIRNDSNLFNYGDRLYAYLIRKGFILVEDNYSKVSGYVIGLPVGSYTGFCLQIGVLQQFRDSGIGTRLMKEVEKYMKDQFNIRRLYAHTIKERSFTYFVEKLNYELWFKLGWFRIITKKI